MKKIIMMSMATVSLLFSANTQLAPEGTNWFDGTSNDNTIITGKNNNFEKSIRNLLDGDDNQLLNNSQINTIFGNSNYLNGGVGNYIFGHSNRDDAITFQNNKIFGDSNKFNTDGNFEKNYVFGNANNFYLTTHPLNTKTDRNFIVGESNKVGSSLSYAFGYGNSLYGNQTYAVGINNTFTNTSSNSLALGLNNTISVSDAFTFGRNNNVSSLGSMSFGFNNTVSGLNSFAFGQNITVIEDNIGDFGNKTLRASGAISNNNDLINKSYLDSRLSAMGVGVDETTIDAKDSVVLNNAKSYTDKKTSMIKDNGTFVSFTRTKEDTGIDYGIHLLENGVSVSYTNSLGFNSGLDLSETTAVLSGGGQTGSSISINDNGKISLRKNNTSGNVTLTGIEAGTNNYDAVNVEQLHTAKLDTYLLSQTYTQSAISNLGIVNETTIDSKDSVVLNSANSYTDTVANTTLTNANSYTDTAISNLSFVDETTIDAKDSVVLNNSKSYTDTAISNLSFVDEATIDAKDSVVLNDAKSYTDLIFASFSGGGTGGTGGVDEATIDAKDSVVLNNAKTYADEGDAKTLTDAKTYADEGDAKTLTDAKTYADEGDAKTLTAAKTYADEGDAKTLTAAKTYADEGDARTLSNANSYTDSKTSMIAQTPTTTSFTKVSGVTGNEHGLYITDTSTTISGGTTSTQLVLDDNGANFSEVGSGKAIKLTGVAKGTNDTDAANTKQVNDAKAEAISESKTYADLVGETTLTNAKTYTDSVVTSIGGMTESRVDEKIENSEKRSKDYTDSRISALEESLTKEYRSATATAIALGVSPILSNGNKNALGIGLGHYEGENAMAINYVAEIDKNVHLQLGASLNAKSQGFKAGVSYGW